MQLNGYSPYKRPARFKKRSFINVDVNLSVRTKKWLWIVLGALFSLFLIFYLSLGDLRFVMNHYLGLTFFRKHYLVILQNNYELRPAGGFVTAYGELTTTLGLPTHMSFSNSYEIETEEYVEAPAPQKKWLDNEWYQGYTFRDANWHPDFPQAAQELKEFYLKKFPDKEVDGMIVVNFSVIEELIEALGGVEIEGQWVESDELFSLLTQQVNNVDRHSEEALMNRKDILGPLYKALMKKAIWHPFKVRRVLEQALEEKEAYAWLESNRLQRRLEKRGWANRLNPDAEQDFVALNVANLGAKKADRYLQKQMNHFVKLTGNVPVVRTELTFSLPGERNQYMDNYRGYMRLYLPEGAELSQKPEESTVTAEDGFTMIGQDLEFAIGEEQSFVYEYTLPRTLWDGEVYHLNLIKQSGSELLTKVLIESAPHRLLESDTLDARENRATWQGMLEKDESLSIQVRPDLLSPFPTEQKFESLDKLILEWNEPLTEAVARDATNYVITDRNVTNTEVTDEVKVVYAELDGNRVILELEGVTEQPLERYTLTLKNLRDSSGNSTDPSPLEVTVVQRLNGEGIERRVGPEEE